MLRGHPTEELNWKSFFNSLEFGVVAFERQDNRRRLEDGFGTWPQGLVRRPGTLNRSCSPSSPIANKKTLARR